MSAHTPGPWEYVYFDNVIVSSAGRILDVQPRSLHVSKEERNANGFLAAAAPELLEALILMVRTHDEPAETLLQEAKEQQWVAKARAAIEKAVQP